jgi:hypothetical protein
MQTESSSAFVSFWKSSPQVSTSPAVWVISWSSVAEPAGSAAPGRYVLTGTSSLSFPCAASWLAASAVKLLVMEPIWAVVSAVKGVFASRLA